MFRSKMSRLKNDSHAYDGLWFSKAVHPRTAEDLLKEISKSYLLHHLRQVEVVDIDGIGCLKLEVKGQGV